MSNALVAVPLLIIAAYVVVSIRLVPRMFRGTGTLRDQVRAIANRGPGAILAHTWRSLLVLLVGLVVMVLSIAAFFENVDYRAAPVCRFATQQGCRATEDLVVSRVDTEFGKSRDRTVVYFAGRSDTATFDAGDLPAYFLRVGEHVQAEVWRSRVTALTVDGVKHQSFATQSDAWIGIAAGFGLLLVGLTWFVLDLAVEIGGETYEPAGHVFASPVKRRRALYVLLPMFGAWLVFLALAYVAIWLGSIGTADTFAAIYFLGGLATVPVVAIVFVAWFLRAYANLSALGLRVKHSTWFALIAMLIPPLSLYMPWRLTQEIVDATGATVPSNALRAWWPATIGWLALTIGGVALSTPAQSDMSLSNQLSNVMLIASVLVGLLAIWLTITMIRAIDSAELDAAARHQARH